VSLAEHVISLFGEEAFSKRPTFYNVEGALRFELGVGDDRASYMSTALHRLHALLDDLGFKDHPIGIAAYYYTYDSTADEQAPPLHQQILPFARELRCWEEMKFCRSNFLRFSNDEDCFFAYHFGQIADNKDRLSTWINQHLMRGFEPSNLPLLMLFSLDLGIMINPYDDRGMDVFGPNRDLLELLYTKRNGWLLDYDREQMDAIYKDT
tara:strand:+ start:471 stop:1097 length:627 start_codon:yes stop_codon:yes gene_type:complete